MYLGLDHHDLDYCVLDHHLGHQASCPLGHLGINLKLSNQ